MTDEAQIIFDRELKATLLEMLAWFHDFCGAHSLRYYVLGGTMLGAVRHRGFIPWDDDIDVGMPRADYERLAAEMAGAETGKYRLETPRSPAADFLYTFSKLYDTTTTLVENTRKRTRRGVYLDLFPLDGLGDTWEESKRRFRPINLRFDLLLARAAGVRSGRSGWKNLAVRLAPLLPDGLVENKALQRRIDELCRERDFDRCKYGGNLLGAWRFKEVMERRIMGEPTPYSFEGLTVYGAEHGEEYLTHLYGDWRTLPPPEQRVTHHDFLLCDLHRSYLEQP